MTKIHKVYFGICHKDIRHGNATILNDNDHVTNKHGSRSNSHFTFKLLRPSKY